MKRKILITLFLFLIIILLVTGYSPKTIIEKEIIYIENKSKTEDLQTELDICKEVLKLKSDIPASRPSNKVNVSISINQVKIEFDKTKCRFVGYGTDMPIDCSKSMIPYFDCYNKVFVCRPESSEEINIGDIIIFELNEDLKKINDAELMIHRIVKRDYDSDGLYFETRADNSNTYSYVYSETKGYRLYLNDAQKIRFEDILYKEEKLW